MEQKSKPAIGVRSKPVAKPRVLVFIVAYHAETTIRDVLSRIPESLQQYDSEVLIIDDASVDATFEEALRHAYNSDIGIPITVLANLENQGYGGNQKLGFQYAVDKGFDVVALVHGDGQYAPEKLPELLEPILKGDADAVFGSRMLTRGGARKGGMPLYKFVGNRILTTYQNRVLRSTLSEFHSGYRAYATSALRRVPFALNTREFHFDTEIIIQLMLADCRIKEVPIPTYYGEEISRVNGMKYAFDVVWATTVARLQSMGLMYARKFDITPKDSRLYQPKLGYDSSHTMAIAEVSENSRVLDIGCAGGFVGKSLKNKGCHVIGVDAEPLAVRSGVDEFFQCDLDREPLPVPLAAIDTVLLLDIVEHLKAPEAFVARIAEAAKLSPGVRIVLTTPNIGFVVTRMMHLFGSFNYGKRGILDMTHTRLFTFATVRKLLEEGGFKVVRMRGIPAPFPLALGDGWLSRALLSINRILIWVLRGVFAYQILVTAKPLPSLDYLLTSATELSDRRREKFDKQRRKRTSVAEGDSRVTAAPASVAMRKPLSG